MTEVTAYLPVAFLVGLLSSLHCIGMCGGVMGALSFGLGPDIKASQPRLLLFLSSYNLGRLLSYTLAGGIMGVFGAGLIGLLEPWLGQGWLQRLAALVMLLIGLYLAGWLPQFLVIERIGRPLWRWLGPMARRLMPVQTPEVALIYGLVWGWLPCGLVYAMLLVAAGQGAFWSGALTMAFFGLGTWPAMLLTGVLAGRIQRWVGQGLYRRLAGVSVLGFALWVLVYPSVEGSLLRLSN
jgi:sulfite exporter TauE/SafE